MRQLVASLLFAVMVGAGLASAQTYLPNPSITPEAINPAVTQENLHETVCVPGWTRTIRPSSSYVRQLEHQQIREQGLPGNPRDYHEDHLVPLCAGGHPSDPKNLWPQPISGQWADKFKNQLEGSVCRIVCRGAMSLQEAQSLFLAPADWTESYMKFFELE